MLPPKIAMKIALPDDMAKPQLGRDIASLFRHYFW
jgi:hypothetical protein